MQIKHGENFYMMVEIIDLGLSHFFVKNIYFLPQKSQNIFAAETFFFVYFKIYILREFEK